MLNRFFGYIFRSQGRIPHFRKPFWMFVSEKDFFHISSLVSTVRKSDFDNRFLFIFTRLNNTFPQWSFNDLKTETSNGCNTSVAWAGSLMTVTFFSFAKHIVPHHKWDRCPSYINRRGSISSVPWLYGINYV